MSVATTTALAIGVGVAGAASAASGIYGAHEAGEAANSQKQTAQQAQTLEQQNQQAGIAAQNKEWSGTQAAVQPYQALWSTSANAYSNLLAHPFTAPTLAQAEATPGYQFALGQGTQAINENAAATGNLMSGNTGVALTKFGQGLAGTTYQQAYQNALNTYSTNLNAAGQGVNVGLSSTGQLGQFGQASANNLANLYLGGGAQQASQLNNQGAAVAAGDIGSANAYSNMANGIAGAVTQGATVNALSNAGYFNSPYGGSVGGYAAYNPYSTAAIPEGDGPA